MKKFLAIYRSNATAQEQMHKATPEQQKQGMDKWMAWMKREGKAIVDMGSPLGERTLIGGASHKDTSHIGGFSILQAEKLEDLQKVFEGHPHLEMPGNSIEVHDFLAMPGM